MRCSFMERTEHTLCIKNSLNSNSSIITGSPQLSFAGCAKHLFKDVFPCICFSEFDTQTHSKPRAQLWQQSMYCIQTALFFPQCLRWNLQSPSVLQYAHSNVNAQFGFILLLLSWYCPALSSEPSNCHLDKTRCGCL